VVEAIATDRDTGGDRESRKREADYDDPQLQPVMWADPPSRHRQRGQDGHGGSDAEHELELQALLPACPAQAPPRRRRPERDPGPPEQPAEPVDHADEARPALDAGRVLELAERRERPGP